METYNYVNDGFGCDCAKKKEDIMKKENVMKNEMKIVKRDRMRDLYLNGVEIQGVRSYILEEDVDSIPVIKLEILLSDITIMDEEDYYFGDEFYWDNDNDLDDYDDDDNDINSNNEGE